MRNNIKVIAFIILFFSILEPDYFTSIKIVHSYYLVSRVGIFLIAIIYLVRKKQIPKITLIMVVYYLIYAFSTYINNGELIYLFTSALYIINFVVWLEIILKNYTKEGLYSLNFVFSTFVYLNLLSFLIFPDGYIQIITDHLNIVPRYFLGVYNQFASFLIPAAVINVIYAHARYGKLKLESYILLATITFTFFYFGSATSIVGILLIILYLVFSHRQILNVFINYKVILPSIGVIYIFFIFLTFEDIPFLSYVVEDLLNKDLTFSSRTIIWDKAIEIIKESLYLGHGYLTEGRYLTLWPAEGGYLTGDESLAVMQSLERDAHNSMLQYILQHGIIGFIPLIFLLVLFVKNIVKIQTNYLSKFILFSFFVSALMMIAEVYSFTFILTILMLGIFMPEIISYQKKELSRNIYEK